MPARIHRANAENLRWRLKTLEGIYLHVIFRFLFHFVCFVSFGLSFHFWECSVDFLSFFLVFLSFPNPLVVHQSCVSVFGTPWAVIENCRILLCACAQYMNKSQIKRRNTLTHAPTLTNNECDCGKDKIPRSNTAAARNDNYIIIWHVWLLLLLRFDIRIWCTFVLDNDCGEFSGFLVHPIFFVDFATNDIQFR